MSSKSPKPPTAAMPAVIVRSCTVLLLDAAEAAGLRLALLLLLLDRERPLLRPALRDDEHEDPALAAPLLPDGADAATPPSSASPRSRVRATRSSCFFLPFFPLAVGTGSSSLSDSSSCVGIYIYRSWKKKWFAKSRPVIIVSRSTELRPFNSILHSHVSGGSAPPHMRVDTSPRTHSFTP